MQQTLAAKTLILTLATALASLPSMANDCRFNGRGQSGQTLAIQCGMSKAVILESIGAPLFYDSGEIGNNGIENWVFRLTNNAGVPKMVSVKLVGGSVDNIIVSR